MDAFSEPQTASETTGLPSLEPKAESSTGPRPGATGSAATPTDCDVGNVIIPPELLAALRAREAERKAEVRSAIAEKRWFRASVTQLLNGEGKTPAILKEPASEATGYTGGWLPPSVSDAQGAEIAEELALAKHAVAPSGPEATGLILAKLAVVLIVPDVSDAKLMMQTYIEDLEHVPVDVLDDACRQWRRTQKFWPTIAELLELCESEVRERRRRLRRLAELDSVRRNPAPGCIVAADWHRERTRDAHRALEAPAKPRLTVVGE